MSAANTIDLVRRVIGELEAAGIRTWLCGGWAEELHGLVAPRPHHDIDLLFPGSDFASVDYYLDAASVDEILAKRFPHKRAFEVDNVMVELLLVQGSPTHRFTDFWGTARHVWPADLFDSTVSGLRVASIAALHDYRAKAESYRPIIDGRVVTTAEWQETTRDSRSESAN